MYLFYNKLFFKLFILDILIFSACSTCTNQERKKPTNLNIITTPPINKENKKLDENKKATSKDSHQEENEETNKKNHQFTESYEYLKDDDLEQALNVLQTQIKEIGSEIEAKEKLVNYKVQELSKSDEITAGTIQRIKQNLEALRIIHRSTEDEYKDVYSLYEKILEVIESVNSQNNISENLRSAINDLEIDIKYLQELDVKKDKVNIIYNVKTAARRINNRIYGILKKKKLPIDLHEKLKILVANQELRKKNAESSMFYIYEEVINFLKDIRNNSGISANLKSNLEEAILDFNTMRILERL